MSKCKKRIIIIYGGNGWLGQKFTKLLHPDWNVYISKLRADNYNHIKQELEIINPHNVLCCIGRTHGGKFTTNTTLGTVNSNIAGTHTELLRKALDALNG